MASRMSSAAYRLLGYVIADSGAFIVGADQTDAVIDLRERGLVQAHVLPAGSWGLRVNSYGRFVHERETEARRFLGVAV